MIAGKKFHQMNMKMKGMLPDQRIFVTFNIRKDAWGR